MKLAWFGVEEWLNPMDSLAKHNFGTSCVKALTMDELFRVTGQDQKEFFKFMETMSLHYHHGDATGSPRLKAAVAGVYPKGDVKPEQIMMTLGGTSANDIVIMGLLDPRDGDNCVVIKPNYQQHYDIPKSIGVETRIVELKEEDDYYLDMDALRAACDKNTKLIAFSNPNNPTGRTMYDKELKEVVEIAKSVDSYILSDEVYRGMDETYMPSILDYGYEKAIAISSLSKMYSLSGLRTGWIVCKDKDVYEDFKTRRSYNTICCGIVDDALACIAIENYEKLWARSRSILMPNKKIVTDWVKSHPHLSMKGDPKGTTCVISYDYDIDSEKLAFDMMEDDAKILVVPGKYFDMEGCFRLGYGGYKDPEALKTSLDVLGNYLQKYE
jgi:aspartate/methionine/tyrosine aminotransferase